MKAYPKCSPGAAIRSVAYTGGIGDTEAALGITALLGGIAGSKAAMIGPSGERIHPGINLIAAGVDSPEWQRAQEMMIDPLASLQRMLREMSHSTARERLDHLQYRHTTFGDTDEIVRGASGGLFENVRGDANFAAPDRTIVALRNPSFMLQDPEPAAFAKAMGEMLDRSALVICRDGQVLSELLRKRPGKKWLALAVQIASMIVGSDQAYNPSPQEGPGQIATCSGHLFVTCSRAQLMDALGLENDSIQRILRHSVMVGDLGPVAPDPLSIDYVRAGYQAFYEGAKTALKARRSGSGVCWDANRYADLAALHSFELEIQAWTAQLPDGLKPFFRHAQSLPYRLLWAFALVTGYQESHDWVFPFALYVTRETLIRQAELLGEFMGAAEKRDYEYARMVMLRKLEKPRMLRDLMRSYAVQRQEVHEPVLNGLIEDGLVRLTDAGLFELSPEGRQVVA